MGHIEKAKDDEIIGKVTGEFEKTSIFAVFDPPKFRVPTLQSSRWTSTKDLRIRNEIHKVISSGHI